MEFVEKSYCVPYEIYERIIDDKGFKGTVRYIGPVVAAKNQSDIWLGIEWDINSRGKHDGSCIDSTGTVVRYFQCEVGRGSFVKPNIVKKGRNFTEALLERYISIDAPITAPDAIIPGAYVNTIKGNTKQIELVGERKIRERQQVEVVIKASVRADTVSTADDATAKIASHFIELDLQENLIWQWREVAKLTIQLPVLHTLCLHSNKMQPLSRDIASSLPSLCFHTLRVLALNNCNLNSFNDVVRLETLLPNIEEIYLALNRFQDTPYYYSESTTEQADEKLTTQDTIKGFSKLRVMDLSACHISSWRQVLYLGTLPCLSELRLDGNPISSTLSAPAHFFAVLQQITMGSTNLSNWSDVDALSTYPSLKSLRLSHVPLLRNKSSSEARVEVVGRLPQLMFFNGSTISAKEKLDAERTYLRRTMRSLAELKERAAEGDAQAQYTVQHFDSFHPRLQELSVRFAADLIAASSATGQTSLSSDMITVRLHNLSTGGSEAQPKVKRLPASLVICKLKLMIKQLYGVAPHVQQLSYRNDPESIPSVFDDDDASLSYFGVTENADIFVNEV